MCSERRVLSLPFSWWAGARAGRVEGSLGDHERNKVLRSQLICLARAGSFPFPSVHAFWNCVHLSRRHMLPCCRKPFLPTRLHLGLEFLHSCSIPRRKERKFHSQKDWCRSLLRAGEWRQLVEVTEGIGSWREGWVVLRECEGPKGGKENTGYWPESEGHSYILLLQWPDFLTRIPRAHPLVEGPVTLANSS